jgi:hypothetical protein
MGFAGNRHMKRRHLRVMFLVLFGVAGAQAATAPSRAEGGGFSGVALLGFGGEISTEPPPFEPGPPGTLALPPLRTVSAIPGDSGNGGAGAGNVGGSGGFPGSPGPDLGLGGLGPSPSPWGQGGQGGGAGSGAVPIASAL